MATVPKSDLEFIAETRAAAGRRPNNMGRVLEALDGCAVDLYTFAGTPHADGVAYDVARRIRKAMAELQGFRARDLLNTRKAES